MYKCANNDSLLSQCFLRRYKTDGFLFLQLLTDSLGNSSSLIKTFFTMLRHCPLPAHLLLVVILSGTALGNPLEFFRLVAEKHNGNRGGINSNLLEPSVYENTAESASAESRLQDYGNDWTQITQNPVSTLNVAVGQRVELECVAMGAPPPQILWLRGGNPENKLKEQLSKSVADNQASSIGWEGLGKTNSKLVIECVRPEDDGLIHCASVSGDKMQISSPTMLSVTGDDEQNCSINNKPIVTLHSPTRLALAGTTAVLPCRASGVPRPHTSWVDSDNQLIHTSADSRRKILRNGDLMIENIAWEDMGQYTCIAKSANKENNATTFLYPLARENKER